MKDKNIYYVDALCGAGKTTAAIQWALNEAKRGERICFVQPTIELINQTYDSLIQENQSACVTIEKFTSEIYPGSVVTKIANFLRACFDPGTILIITINSFLKLRYFHQPEEWIIIFDEIPNPFNYGEIKAKKTFSSLLPGLEEESINQVMSELSFPHNKQHILKNCSNDESLTPYAELSELLQNQKYKVCVKSGDFKALFTRGNQKSMYFLAILDLGILLSFKKIIVMGACFHDSFFKIISDHYKVSNRINLYFREHEAIKNKLHNNTSLHQNAGKLKILYGYERTWSKTFFNKMIPNSDLRYVDEYVEAINTEFADNEFIFSINNDEENLVSKLPNGERVSGMPFGINEYQSYDHSAYISANNPHPQFYILLKAFGIDSESIKTQMHFHAAYQFIMRSSLRTFGAKGDCTIIVPTLELANYLKNKFSNATIDKLKNTSPVPSYSKRGRKKKICPKSPQQKTEHSRRREYIAEVEKINCNFNSNYIKDKKVTKYSLSSTISYQIFQDKFSLVDNEMTIESSVQEMMEDWESFITLARENEKETGRKKKDDHYLISTAKFKGTRRLLKEVEYIFGIWLDFDGGDFSPKDLMTLFPDNYIVIFNTFTTERNRFRAFFPTDMILTPWAFKDICRTISAMIEDSGYRINPKGIKEGDKVCMLDHGKFNAASIFYAPRDSEHKKRGSTFYKHQKGEFLDVDYFLHYPMHQEVYELIIKNIVQEDIGDTIKNNSETMISLNNQIEVYRSLRKGSGKRHYGFFKLAVSLSYLTKDEQEIRRQLEIADWDGARGKKGINDCIKNLYRYGRFLKN